MSTKGIYAPLSDASNTGRSGHGYMSLGDSLSYSTGANGPGWGELACALSNQRLHYLGQACVGGTRLAEQQAFLSAGILPYKPDYVSVYGGTADIINPDPTRTTTLIEDLAETHRQICATLLGAGITPIICVNPPQWNSAYRANQIRYANYLRTYARVHKLPCIDFWSLLCDPAGPSLLAQYDSGDGVHPNQAAHLMLAQYFVTNFINTIPAYGSIRASCVVDDDNMAYNPLFTVGSPPTYYSVSGSTMTGYTEGVVSDSDFVGGKAWEWNFTNPSSATGYRALGYSVPVSAGSALEVGDTLLLSIRQKVVSNTGVTYGQDVGVKHLALWTAADNPTTTLMTGYATPHNAALFQWQVVVPAKTTSAMFLPLMGNVPTNAQLTARIGEFGIFNLTKMRMV